MEKNLYKELFEMVYQWGRVGVKVNEKSKAFQEKIKEIEDKAIDDWLKS